MSSTGMASSASTVFHWLDRHGAMAAVLEQPRPRPDPQAGMDRQTLWTVVVARRGPESAFLGLADDRCKYGLLSGMRRITIYSSRRERRCDRERLPYNLLNGNRLTWDVDYSWADGGDSWSEQWGGPEKQWRGAILPRIRAFVPARTCLEIAPGHGRWTQFLKDLCDQLIVVDLSASCIAACQQRFSNCANIR